MPTYMLLARFTDRTAMGFAERASKQTARRIADQVRHLAAAPPLNGRVEHLFFTAGEDELVLVLDMPSQKQAVAFNYALINRLGVRTRLQPAFDATEMERIQHDAEAAAKIGGPTSGARDNTADEEDQQPVSVRP